MRKISHTHRKRDGKCRQAVGERRRRRKRKPRVGHIHSDSVQLEMYSPSVAMEISMSMPAQRVIKALEKNGKPKRIRTDNGPEFISKELEAWCTANGVEHVFTQPGW